MRFLCWVFRVDCEPPNPRTDDLERAMDALAEIRSGVFFLDEALEGMRHDRRR